MHRKCFKELKTRAHEYMKQGFKGEELFRKLYVKHMPPSIVYEAISTTALELGEKASVENAQEMHKAKVVYGKLKEKIKAPRSLCSGSNPSARVLMSGIFSPMLPPEVTVRKCRFPEPFRDKFPNEPDCKELFVGPTDATIYYLQRMLPPHWEYYEYCPKHRKMFGYPDLEIMIKSSIEWIDPSMRPWLRELLRKLRKEKQRIGLP